MEIFCALAGVLFAYTQHPLILIALLFLLFLRRRLRFLLIFILALCWALLHEWWVLPGTLPEKVDPARVVLRGHVFSKPDIRKHRTRFQFVVDTVNGKPQSFLVLLSWYQNSPQMQLGDSWELTVSLKKPRNLKNPGAFDYERSMQAKHISWTGYVRSGFRFEDPESSKSIVLKSIQLREKWAHHLGALAPDKVSGSIMQALTLGLTSEISQEDWNLFRRTGTTHLMVISGAHIGLVAGLVFGLVNWIWRRTYRGCLYSPAPRVASIFSIFAALIYACIAGFAVPAQRSLLACGFAFFRYFGNQRYSGWQGWRYGLLFALIFEPHAVLLPGFYLSFLAVAILIVVQQRWPRKGLAQLFSTQLACLIGLMPLTLYWFSYASVNGFFANLIAIPLVGFLIVPLSLLTLLLMQTDIAWVSMKLCAILIQILMKILALIENISWINLDYSIANIVMMLSLMGGMLVLVLLPVRAFAIQGFILIVCAFFPAYPKVKFQQAHIRVLDVGQGLAVLIQTAEHTLLYDAGDAFSGGSDMGTLAILPAMRALGLHALDMIVISHPDKDHYGGLKSVESVLKHDGLFIVNDPDYYKRGSSCHNYPSWEWDGVEFTFLAINNHFTDKNNTSCILKISAGNKHMLLTGDIEKAAEKYLADTWKDALQSDVLLLAHHGSKTSSSALFMEQVAPQHAIASTGFANRYHFPHASTLEICARLGIDFYNTAENGMISVQLGENKVEVSKYG